MAVAPAITAELLKRRSDLDSEQKDLERQARALGKEKSAIDTDLKAELERVKKTTIARGGYRVSIVDGRPSVSWKGEFVRLATAQVAAEIEKAAPVSKRIEVIRDGTPANSRRAA